MIAETLSVVVTKEETDYITTQKEANVVVDRDYSSIVRLSETDTIVVERGTDSVVVTGLVGPVPSTIIAEEDMAYSKRIDFISESELYRGEAAPGTLETSAAWRIRKIVIANDDDITETWADGNANFDNVWSDHLTLTYT